MLAERKQKQRWYLNPRANKEWAQDANKFGQRMLEKMGWTAGKGLGANEDGITDHIKVKYKNDIQGIGYQLRDDQWTQHENNFTQLLTNLGSGTEVAKSDLPKSEKSLEKKSQKSRARVHYHKFTRGKDLAARSEKDLANIFGRKTLEKTIKKEVKEELDNGEKESKAFGVVTIKSGNMADYFKSKFNKLGDKFSMASNKEDGDEPESEIGGRTAGFGFNSGNKENKHSFINFVSNNSKSNEKEDESESEISTTIGFGFSSTSNNNKQSFMSFVSSSIQKEENTENQSTGIKRKRTEIEDTNLPKDKTKKKNKKKKNVAFDNKGNDINISEEVCYDNPCLNEENNHEEQNIEENGLDNPAFNSNDELDKKIKSVTFASPVAEYSTISEDSSKKKKKKKLVLGIDNPACEEQSFRETSLDDVNEENNFSRKRKSRDNLNYEESTPVKISKKKKKNVETGIENLACDEIDSKEINLISQSKIKKSKKKKNEDSIVEVTSPKKSKKKKKSSENGITNLACEESPINCVDNLACSVNLVEEGIECITNAIDNYQSELENEMNVRKDKKMQKTRK